MTRKEVFVFVLVLVDADVIVIVEMNVPIEQLRYLVNKIIVIILFK